jgi:hypothetical protein
MLERSGAGAVLLLALLAGAAFAAEPTAEATSVAEPETPKEEYEILAEFVTDDSLSAMRYFRDGLVTLNERCPVRLVSLNRKMEAAYVNGRPVGFC